MGNHLARDDYIMPLWPIGFEAFGNFKWLAARSLRQKLLRLPQKQFKLVVVHPMPGVVDLHDPLVAQH